MSVAFVESVKRCTQDATFVDRFYDQLLSRNAYIRQRFAQEDAFLHKFMLKRLLLALVRNASNVSGSDRALDTLADDHGPAGLNLPTSYYESWLEALLLTVREVDRELSPAVDAEWREVMSVQVARFAAAVRSRGMLPPAG